MKKLLAMVLALVMTLSLAVSANAAFKDDKDISADYAEAAAVLDGMGVFEGVDGSFLPKDNITRAQVATIIYRVATADTAGYGKDKSGLYATYNKFSDMTGAGWASGYIGYAANAEYVKGYPDGTFKPSGNVTGYEVLAMILRVVGYDKNNEFSGADWALNVAKYAEQLGILKNVAKTTDLSAPASRELVAELLFQAIQVPTVTYTPAFGYQTDKVQKLEQVSIGYKNFKLASDDSEDAWGRPTTVWFEDSDKDLKFDSTEDTYAEVTATPKATFNVETSQCDICEALGVKKTTTVVDTYTNGKLDTKDVTYTATATKAMVGAQGQQLEYYKVDGGYRLVVIDTYLAKVDTVKAEKTDAKGHVTSDAYMALTVYTTSAGKTMYVKGDDYAKGDYVLVNVNEESANNVSIVGFTNKQPLVEIVGKADSIEGAQTKIWKNADKHTVADKDYMDAVQFNHNEAGDSTVKFTWLFDQFGNLIGSVALDRSNYAVLKDIIWNTGRPGYAEATLISMVDGKEYTATVDTFDGFYPSYYDEEEYVEGSWMYDEDYDNLEPTHADIQRLAWFGLVGDDSVDNDNYRGLAMYRVDTNDDGTVKLQGFAATSTSYADIVSYAEGATVDVKTSAILDEDGKELGSLTKTTNFLIREGKGTKADPFTYELKTGTKELPAMQLESVNLFYVDSDNDGFVDYVYIQSYVSDTLAPSYVFAYEESAKRDPDTNVWTMNVYVNGEKKDIELENADYELLSENVGKLFIATFDTVDGYVDELMLVNEAHDGTDAYPVTDTAVDYVTGKLESSDGRLKNTEAGAVKTYNTEDATLISTVSDYATMEDVEKASADELAKVGVWVVTNEKGAYTEATYVYVGEKLSGSVALTVTSKDGEVSYDKDAKQFTVTLPATFDKDNTVVTLTADGASSLVKGALDRDFKAETTTDTVLIPSQVGQSRGVTVWNEEGTAHAEYTVKVATTVAATAEVNDLVVTVGSTNLSGKVTAYKSLADAVANANKVALDGGRDLTVEIDGGAHWVEGDVCASSNAALASTVNGQTHTQTTDSVHNANIASGTYIVVGVGVDGSNYYVVYLVK